MSQPLFPLSRMTREQISEAMLVFGIDEANRLGLQHDVSDDVPIPSDDDIVQALRQETSAAVVLVRLAALLGVEPPAEVTQAAANARRRSAPSRKRAWPWDRLFHRPSF